MKLQEADKVANEFIGEIDQFCRRAEIAGSIRRKKETVGDIEVVCEPEFSKVLKTESLIEEYEDVNLLHKRLTLLRENGVVRSDRISKDGRAAPFGKRYYRLTYFPFCAPEKGYSVDLFAVIHPRDWGVIYLIRTGSGAFSHWIVTYARRRGMCCEEGVLWKRDYNRKDRDYPRAKISVKIPCPEEKNFFEALVLKWVPPERREMKGYNAQRYQVKR